MNAPQPATPSTPAVRVSVPAIVWPYLRPYRWHLALAIGLNSIHGFAITAQTMCLPLVIGIVGDTALSTAERWRRALLVVALYLFASFVARMGAWHLGYRVFTWVRERVVLALRATFFRHVNHLCLRFHGTHPSGELFSYLFGSPLGQIMQFYQHTSMFVPGAIFTIITTILWLGAFDWALTGVLAVLALASALVMQHSMKRWKAIAKEFQAVEGDTSGHVADLLRGNRAVKLYAMEQTVASEFEALAQQLGRKSYQRDISSHIQWMKQEAVGYFAYVALILIGIHRFHQGALGDATQAIAAMSAYLAAYAALGHPLQSLFQAGALLGGAQASVERIGAVLQTASSTPDPVGAAKPVPERGDIRFDRVSFAYEPGQPVLRDLTLTIPYGQKVAVVGPSGVGKSTLMQLLLRLYDPQEGAIALDGTDLRSLRGADLRRRFGVVPQDPFIFRSTLRDNVRVARPDADDAAIGRACELANCWEFIDALPDGLQSRVGEGGSTLSGGQRQRLAIARVLLAQPPFFIFDEATSALDTLSERLIQEAIERNLGGRTAIFIAHRLATVKHVDRILVLRDGRIEQDGTYRELAERPGLFRELVQGQQLT